MKVAAQQVPVNRAVLVKPEAAAVATETSAPSESYSGSASILPRTVLGAAVLGGLGVYAGLNGGGGLAITAGALSGAAGGAFLGTVGAARAGQEEHTGVIASVAAAAGCAAGAYLTASNASPVFTAVVLGATGAACGGFLGMMSYWGKD
jgi:hypothetical protein